MAIKRANGCGSVYKIGGKRRKPYAARVTVGWDTDFTAQKTSQNYRLIGTFATKLEAEIALNNYLQNPYDIDSNKITFEEVYKKWSDEYFQTLTNPSSIRTVTAAYKYCSPLYKIRMRDIKVSHLEQTIKNASVGGCTKARMKSVFNLMYRYAMKHEIVDKNYAALCDSVKKPKPTIKRIPFTVQEIQLLWDNLNFSFTDMILIGLYSGWRPQELAMLQIENIDLIARTMTGGLKTEAGTNRVVPIHPLVYPLVEQNYRSALQLKSTYLFNDRNGQQGTCLTYDKYRGRFKKVMTHLGFNHKPHDTRHTFITNAKHMKMPDALLKRIVGHEVTDVTDAVYTHYNAEDLMNAISLIDYSEKV